MPGIDAAVVQRDWLWQMLLDSRSEPLSHLEVLVIDCQAMAAAPRPALDESRLASALWWV